MGFQVQAQKTVKSGEVVFDLDLDGMDPQAAAFLSDAKANLVFNKNNVKVVTDMGMVKTTVFIDSKENSQITTMDMMGQKFQIDLTDEEISNNKVAESDYEIEVTKDQKDIAGYSCVKHIIKSKDGNLNVWVTDKISVKGNLNHQYESLSGFPLEYSINQNGMSFNLTATKIISRDVQNSEFTIPDGYTKVKSEDLQKMFGG